VYTIKQASLRAGVSVPLLRQWERRYGVVSPARTASGYRLYDDAAIARLRRMRRLIDDGWSASAAAREVEGGPAAVATPDRSSEQDLVQAFIDAAEALDAAGMDAALDEMFVRGSFEQTAEQYLMPAIRAIGAAWAEGRGDIATEHAASGAILHRLGAAYQAAGRSSRGRRPILVGLPQAARHELGALAFSIAARRSGMPVLYLGADLPAQDWTDAARQTHALAAVIGVVTPADIDAAVEVASALEAADPDIRVAFGGPASAGVPPGDRRIRLPDGLAAAVDTLGSALLPGR